MDPTISVRAGSDTVKIDLTVNDQVVTMSLSQADARGIALALIEAADRITKPNNVVMMM